MWGESHLQHVTVQMWEHTVPQASAMAPWLPQSFGVEVRIHLVSHPTPTSTYRHGGGGEWGVK